MTRSMQGTAAARSDSAGPRGMEIPSPARSSRGGESSASRVDAREARLALDLLGRAADIESLLWLPCRDHQLYARLRTRLPQRVFLGDYRSGRLRQLVRDLPEEARGQYRARRLDVPMLDWQDSPVDATWAPGVLSRLAVPADRRLFLRRVAAITTRAMCVSARVTGSLRRTASVGFSGLGPDRPVHEDALLSDFEDVGLAVLERRRVFGPFSDRRLYLLGPVEDEDRLEPTLELKP